LGLIISAAKGTYSAVGGGTDGEVEALAFIESDLYVGGNFIHAGSVVSPYFAIYNTVNATFRAPSSSNVSDIVYCVATDGFVMYLGGAFDDIGGSSFNYIASYDPNTATYNTLFSSSSIDAGVDDEVYTLAVDGYVVYLGGIFTSNFAGDNSPGLIGFNTDTSVWIVLSATTSGSSQIYTMLLYGSILVIGGSISYLNGNPAAVANNLAYVDIVTNIGNWSAVAGTGNPYSDQINALLIDGTTLYIGGTGTYGLYYCDISGTTLSYFTPENGPTSGVSALGISSSTLYVGGSFLSFAGQTGQYLASYDTDALTWSAAEPSSPNSYVYSIAVDSNDNVYIGGSFTQAGGTPSANYIAQYTPSPAPSDATVIAMSIAISLICALVTLF